jgi:uncharacterized protein YegP (UPF0339 family)
MSHFTVQQNDFGLWHYKFISSEGSLLLTGTKHEVKQSCLGEIVSVRMNSVYLENYEKRISPSKDYFFILRSMGSEKIIGVSEMYSHLDGCEKAIGQIRKMVGKAMVK